MTFERSRNLQDSGITPAAFALPAAASANTNSAVIDFGTDTWKPEEIELGLIVPALSTVIVPNASLVNYVIETSTTNNFAAIAETILNDQVAGAGGTGVPAYSQRIRLPSNCAEFVRFRVQFGAACTTGAAVSAKPGVFF